MPCVNEQMLPPGRYVPKPSNQDKESESEFVVEIVEDSEPIPAAVWDPDEPLNRPTAYSHLALPIRVTLNQGDMLYLPAM